jgi:hypothetical protein
MSFKPQTTWLTIVLCTHVKPLGDQLEEKKTILQAFLQVTASRNRVIMRYNSDIVHKYECSQHKTTYLLSCTGLELNTKIQYVAMFITVNTNLVDKMDVLS